MIDIRLPYNTVTSDTYAEFNWGNQINIEIRKCLHDICSEDLQRCTKSLQNVKFSSLTKLTNVAMILENCPNLVNVTFDDAIIDEYKHFCVDNNVTINNENISTLIIICPWGLTKNEYWLLDFFTRCSNLPNLASMSFYSYTTIGGLGGHGPRMFTEKLFKENTEVMEQFGKFQTVNLVANFISKFRVTLRRLWIGRPGFELKNCHELCDSSCQLKLSFLSVSLGSSGVRCLLQSQTELETLNLVSNLTFKGTALDGIRNDLTFFYECIRRNSRTLKEIKLVPTIISYSSRNKLINENRILDAMEVNCELFSQCSQLEYLCLSLRGYKDDLDMWLDLPPILQGAKLLNLHLIPQDNLIELYLPVEEYSRDELEILAGNFSRFVKLKKLYFGTSQLNPLNSFLIRTPWIESLVDLPQIQRIVLHNGILQDPDATRRLIANRNQAGLFIITMTFTSPRYTFEIHREPMA